MPPPLLLLTMVEVVCLVVVEWITVDGIIVLVVMVRVVYPPLEVV